MLWITSQLSAQSKPPRSADPAITTDPYRIDYRDVFDNMHYNQPLRPQVHYTPLTGQIADATGLVKYNGKYHLFYMYDEWSRQRKDNKAWGHATSEDCIHWEQQPQINNTVLDNRPGSGSGIIDWNNTLGLQTGADKTMVVFYTDYGRGICIAFSRDAGKTWIRHKNNPVMPAKEGTRDPNVFWYKPDQSWRMVIYDQPGFAFYKSKDLLNWQFSNKMNGFFECPDFMQMKVDGKEDYKQWVLIDGNGSYFIGNYDGTRFTPRTGRQALGQETYLTSSGGKPHYYTKDVYATQTWKQTYEADGPFIQMAFMMIPGPPVHDRVWSQQMIFPVELTLKTIAGQLKLCRNPIDAIKELRYDPKLYTNLLLEANENPLEAVHADVFELIADIDLLKSPEFILTVRGEKAVYNASTSQLQFMGDRITVLPRNNTISLRMIVDRNSVEIYANQGEAGFTRLFYPDSSNRNLSLVSTHEAIRVCNMEVYRLESIWLKREQELGYKRSSGHE